jgi:hypothetical protein
MYPLSADDAFFQSLCDLDYQIFLIQKAKACPACGGKLDTAHYPRKPRGLGEKQTTRFSLCCRKEGCRSRQTPPSLRFLGRKVYSAWVVILAPEFCHQLGLQGQIAHQTIARWRGFWAARLAETHPFMRWARATLPPRTPSVSVASGLLATFDFPARTSWVLILRFFTHVV